MDLRIFISGTKNLPSSIWPSQYWYEISKNPLKNTRISVFFLPVFNFYFYLNFMLHVYNYFLEGSWYWLEFF